MALTPAQQQTLKSYVNGVPELASQPLNGDGAYAIANVINQTAAPAYIVWRGPMPVMEIEQNGFAWNQIDSVPAAKFRIWELLRSSGTINPSKVNVRQGINDFCKDANNAVLTTLRDSILPHLKRSASVVEKLFATGTGTDATPATMGFEGPIGYQDVEAARNS